MSSGKTEPAALIGDYELLRVIARGAYGEVWLARNVPGSFVALKIIRRDSFSSDRPFEREFEGVQRFEAISRSHPSHLAILHVGKSGATGCFYYVMELADDANTQRITVVSAEARPPHSYTPRTLRHDLRTHGRLTAVHVLELGLRLTEALTHLHEHRLVHRDIKPSNIIFANGRPKLADIGLVTDVTDEHSFVGTEGYLAPEGPGTPQADIFALGKVLYEALTGLDRRQFPELPADIGQWPDAALAFELNAIVVKACAADIRLRYGSAQGLILELQSVEAGRSVKRRRVWQKTFFHTKKIAFVACLMLLGATMYWVAVRRSPAAHFTRSNRQDANEEYSEGVSSLHAMTDGLKAIVHFENAIKIDPRFAEAYAHLASAWLSVPGDGNSHKARLAAEKAVSLDPKSAAAHAFLASAKEQDLDWAGAEKERALAISLNPNSEEILLESALNLSVMGRTNEALVILDQALRMNPDSASNLRRFYSGFVYSWCRQYDRAIRVFSQRPPEVAFGVHEYAQAFLAKGDYVNAIRLERIAVLKSDESPSIVNAEFDALSNAFARSGPRGYWKCKLEFERPRDGGRHLMRMAAIHARLNQPKEAFKFLRRAMKETPVNFGVGIYTNPSFDGLRSDPCFVELVRELHWDK